MTGTNYEIVNEVDKNESELTSIDCLKVQLDGEDRNCLLISRVPLARKSSVSATGGIALPPKLAQEQDAWMTRGRSVKVLANEIAKQL